MQASRVPEKTMVIFLWIVSLMVAMLIGMVMGYVVGTQSGEAKAYEVMRNPEKFTGEPEPSSPAERRRKANRPWT